MAELASVRRLLWSPYLGHTDGLRWVLLLGRSVRVQDFWVPATRAMNTVLKATGYEDPCDWTGSYNKRRISGSTKWSWHSYGGAIDLDYGGDNPDSPHVHGIDRNPHLKLRIYPGFGTDSRFQITEAQVRAVEAIRTNNGKRVWRWLGWAIGDTMHFEPNCTPADARTGIDMSTVAGAISGTIPPPPPPTKEDDDDMTEFALAIFARWSYADMEAMRLAGYWQGVTAPYYMNEDGTRGTASDESIVNLVVFILGNGNADIPGNAGPVGPSGPVGSEGPRGPIGRQGEPGTPGKETKVFVDGEQIV